MKNKILISLIILFLSNVAFAASNTGEMSDFTGDSFFIMPSQILGRNETTPAEDNANEGTIPPVKLLRQKIQNKVEQYKEYKYQKAPTADNEKPYVGEVETSEYASKEIEPNFEDATPEENELTQEAKQPEEVKVKKKKKFFKKAEKKVTEEETDDIILDCDKVDYDTNKYLITATGNVNVTFVKQNTTIKSDIMIYDRANNSIKAEGHVKIIKGSQVIDGDYIFVDMNEENALIENPVTQTANILMHAKKGYVYGDTTVQEDGSMVVDKSMPIYFRSDNREPNLRNMLIKNDNRLSDAAQQGKVHGYAKEIKITQKGDLETIAFKRFKLKKDKLTILKVPAVKLYTNKNHDYGESNLWEIGSYRGLGAYIGPSWVFELPKGSVLKVAPLLNYEAGFGIGGLGRFSSGTNRTIAAYGTARGKFIIDGEQKLDEHLKLNYGMHAYMDEWFLGRRRPKYGLDLVYQNRYSSDNFLFKGLRSSFEHRLEAGIYRDLDFDNSYEKISGHNVGTTRFRYMLQGNQTLFSYRNTDKLTSLQFGVLGQLSAALYGTGATQVIGRLGPTLHTQYKRWMQDITYYFTSYDDHSPMPVFDAYRYGKQNLALREHLRICKYLTVSWIGSINITNDSPNGERIQENAFFLTTGPDDYKFSIGYDFQRRTLYCIVEFSGDAKGTTIDYEKMEIKQVKKAKENKTEQTKTVSSKTAPTKPQTLKRAEVENLKTLEDVL